MAVRLRNANCTHTHTREPLCFGACRLGSGGAAAAAAAAAVAVAVAFAASKTKTKTESETRFRFRSRSWQARPGGETRETASESDSGGIAQQARHLLLLAAARELSVFPFGAIRARPAARLAAKSPLSAGKTADCCCCCCWRRRFPSAGGRN